MVSFRTQTEGHTSAQHEECEAITIRFLTFLHKSNWIYAILDRITNKRDGVLDHWGFIFEYRSLCQGFEEDDDEERQCNDAMFNQEFLEKQIPIQNHRGRSQKNSDQVHRVAQGTQERGSCRARYTAYLTFIMGVESLDEIHPQPFNYCFNPSLSLVVNTFSD